jgi:SAM-dependent methyltransferase
MNLSEWNDRYRSREEIAGDPAQLLVEAAHALPSGRALDLACGAGRNALWLASRGWEVVAIDGAEEAIRILREHDPVIDGGIDARVMDLEAEAPLPFDDASFDLVAILYYLHRPLFAEAKRLVKPGGIVVCAVKMRGTYRGNPGELAQHFEDFEVLRSSEGEIAELVARRR